MITLKNMPGLNSEAATEVALATRSRVALGNFVSDIAKGEDVKLSNDIYVTEPINVDKATIDLNGHTVTASDTTPFHFTSGESTIKGGTVIGASGVTATAITVSEGATLTIEGGTFETTGTYNEKHWVLNKINGTQGKIEVKGGKFKNFNPANPQTDDDESYLASGYESKSDGDWYVVEKTAAISRKSKKV